VDSNGISLAGSSEQSLETFYVATDAVVIGTDRTQPNIIHFTAPGSNVHSFINSDDDVISGMLNDPVLDLLAGTTNVKQGYVSKVFFPDGTSAEYILVTPTGTPLFLRQWKWNGVAWDAGGNLINKNGTPKSNTNSGGNTTGSNITVPALGPALDGSHYSWVFNGSGICSTEQDLYLIDYLHGTSTHLGSSTFYVPCN
jgi:hypothetical protein